jgi:hypothetical protein
VWSLVFDEGALSAPEVQEGTVGWLKKVGGWLAHAGAATWTFIKRRGPIATNVIGAVAIVWPQLGVAAAALQALLGQGGQLPGGDELTKALAAFLVAALACWRAGAKTLSVYKTWRASAPASAPAK